MFSDEKGYLVTEMVMEEVTDDETDTVPIPTATTSNTNTHSNSMKTAPKAKDTTNNKENNFKDTTKGKKKATVAPSGAQKTMTSFFSKK